MRKKQGGSRPQQGLSLLRKEQGDLCPDQLAVGGQMNKRKALALVIGFLCCLLLGGMALAATPAAHRIIWDVIAGGGDGPASSASHTMIPARHSKIIASVKGL